MNRDNALRAILDTKDETTQFAILKINETTFKRLEVIKKYGDAETFRLAKESLADLFQVAFNEVAKLQFSDVYSLPGKIFEEAKGVLAPILTKFVCHPTEEQEVEAWNTFIRKSAFMETVRTEKGVPMFEWTASLTIRHNNIGELKKAWGDDFETFIAKNIGDDQSKYYFNCKWFSIVDGVACAENTSLDMINTILDQYFTQQHRDLVFEAWEEWLYSHKAEIEGNKQ